ncbi:thymidylate synthase [Gimibacter soli]|uniref:Thymidylate synthase n=1 Tax=Gimibacter soli TaxID=3024400 RepID=A0AAE9XVD4_9PROT|nr:thymidylate synthase [Gimibacter soli]WCL53574.1 thymidylate synthase [Gimibacter soli]
MHQYLNLVREIFDNGSWQANRTGIRTLSIPGAMMKFDLQEGFPAVTTKRLAFKSAIGEMVGFMRAHRSAADFRALGCKVWDQNANENAHWLANPYRLREDDLGPVYGVQWRDWPAYKLIDPADAKGEAQIADALKRGYTRIGVVEDPSAPQGGPRVLLYKAIDQLRQCLDTIMEDPGSRRILFHGWNWAQLEEMALPPCHLLYQFLVNQAKGEISLCLYIRSNDVGLGTPFNLTEGAALLHLVGRLTGYKPRWFTYFIGDAHIYENHVDMLQEQLRREPFPAPQLVLSDRIPDYAVTGKYEPEWLEKVEPGDFQLEGYQHHAPLTAPMAV